MRLAIVDAPFSVRLPPEIVTAPARVAAPDTVSDPFEIESLSVEAIERLAMVSLFALLW